MTIYVLENDLQVEIAFNQANLAAGDYTFTVTSQYSHQSTIMFPAQLLYSNSRYSMFEVIFPVGFGDAHKNGVYYYELSSTIAGSIEKGLAKIITNPGGEIHTLAYDSGLVTEERVSEVYFRPNYI